MSSQRNQKWGESSSTVRPALKIFVLHPLNAGVSRSCDASQNAFTRVREVVTAEKPCPGRNPELQVAKNGNNSPKYQLTLMLSSDEAQLIPHMYLRCNRLSTATVVLKSLGSIMHHRLPRR
jgi:hypothetical protein